MRFAPCRGPRSPDDAGPEELSCFLHLCMSACCPSPSCPWDQAMKPKQIQGLCHAALFRCRIVWAGRLTQHPDACTCFAVYRIHDSACKTNTGFNGH